MAGLVFALPLVALATLAGAQSAPASLEVRFCGPEPLHTYSLSTEANLQSVLLPYALVINRGTVPVDLTAIELALVREATVVDSRALGRSELDTFGKLSQQFEAVPQAKASLELLCGDHLVPKGVALGGPTLAPGQGQLILNQAFAFDGQRDSMQVRATASSKQARVQGDATLPISAAAARSRYRLPVKGVWIVKSGPSFHTHHRWARPSEFGLDLVKLGADGRGHSNDGSRFADYHAYGQDVVAAADGTVVRATGNRPEPTDLLLRTGETLQSFAQRTAAYQQSLFTAGIDGVAGNHVMIDHGNGEYSLYAHLQASSVRVRVGAPVRAGDAIGKVGGSGNALVEPHLHFHVCDKPTPLACAGIPVTFADVEIPFVSFAPRPVQSGDVVIAN
jgi:murein DD-endopeptidase MepM/ murein hydrolase activator NlpD